MPPALRLGAPSSQSGDKHRQQLAAANEASLHSPHRACNRSYAEPTMLEHLLTDDALEPAVAPVDPKAFPALGTLDPAAFFDAQVKTADLIALFDDEENDPTPELQRNAAAAAFMEMTNGVNLQETRAKLAKLKVPRAVRHLVGMLTAYEWEFIDQAKELRGYAVAQILEETKHPDAKIRLRALEMLGKVTEVALFTDRVEVKNAGLSDEELDERLREKLRNFMNATDAVTRTTETVDDILPVLRPVTQAITDIPAAPELRFHPTEDSK